MSTRLLLNASIQEIARRLREGELTVEELTSEALAAARSATGSRAFVWLDESGARGRAESLRSGAPEGPLWGLPVSVKDLFDVAGLPTTCGSPFYAGTRPVPESDAGYVARWRAEGTVILGKTALNEFAYGITGENRCFGDCTQPGHPGRLTGGSSSGAAASVLMGAAAIALGTDTGGSLRVPAALCGLVSYRASLGFADWSGSFPLAHAFDTLGWLQRSLGDVAFVARALHPEVSAPPLSRPPKVAVMTGEWLAPAEPEVLEALGRFSEGLRTAGAEVVEIEAKGWDRAVDLFVPIQAHEAHAIHSRYLPSHSGAYDPGILARLQMGRGVSAARHADLLGEKAEFARRLETLFGDVDLLLAPASAMRVLKAGVDHSATRPRLLRLTAPASLGGLPVLTVPWLEDGLPGLGFQVMAPNGQDSRLWAFAEWLSGAAKPLPVP
jgi:Asp-tRNA(Asn)/Glu-tRNA(Gln) amidotransferase A subunit family amidase